MMSRVMADATAVGTRHGMNNYFCQAQQKWTLKAVPNGGGYPGSTILSTPVGGDSFARTDHWPRRLCDRCNESLV